MKHWAQYWRNEEISPNADSEIFDTVSIINEEVWSEMVQKMVDLGFRFVKYEKFRLEAAEIPG
ncbi:hypothetical protein F9856_10140 [Streptococcus suis]|uniref:hypothetical protein n=1 Tax=Streptococcus suis TaxID=1307 RepID=UPI001920E4BC|nr:hypothetical protein [Streptococcus suis]MBL1126476.1 hypothetical protein [Streptococcus suis]